MNKYKATYKKQTIGFRNEAGNTRVIRFVDFHFYTNEKEVIEFLRKREDVELISEPAKEPAKEEAPAKKESKRSR